MLTTPHNTSVLNILHQLVAALDKEADRLLKSTYGISYKRAYFLLTLSRLGAISQRELAAALNYAPASVSTMLTELSKDGLVTIKPDANHGRRHVVSITPTGRNLVNQGVHFLDEHFKALIVRSGFDEGQYTTMTIELYNLVVTKLQGA